MSKMFHNLSAGEVLKQLQVSANGLTTAEVKQRIAQYGKNKIPEPAGKTLVQIFFSQFLNPLIYVLIAAAIISLLIGDYKDAIFIALIIGLNAALGTYQEWKAENSASALRKLVKVKARVRRNGKVSNVESEDLVPGDIVLLESGNKIPADMRLLEVHDLWLEEALLTGESVPIAKTTQPLEGGPELALGDRTNMVFAATVVQKGRGTAVVASTAENTEIGKIANSLRHTEQQKPPLVQRMDVFSRRISIIILMTCIILGVATYFRGMPAVEIFFLMVAVGVAAIPEGLPVGMTIALSIGTRRMAKRNVIVRKLPAVEGLGSCTLIASDKTGTLTLDQQSVKVLYLPSGCRLQITGQGYNGEGAIGEQGQDITEPDSELLQFLQANILCNEANLRRREDGTWEHSGDAVDVALRALAFKAGKEPRFFYEGAEVVKRIPYESENKFSAVFYQVNGQLHFAIKGAVEVIAEKLTAEGKEAIMEQAEHLAHEGYRVLAIAGCPVAEADINQIQGIPLLALIGMIDPLRPEVKDAVEECKQAGIKVMMVTGDHPATALAIARDLGIASQMTEVITGAELSRLEGLPASELAAHLQNKQVCARVSPLQKQKIVEAMKSLGHYVAVTGDGANDAPALKSAHIGVAMGAGTDLAKEAASIIVTDDNFASIAAGVEEGRFTFDNLRKIIYLLISTGAGLLLTVALCILAGLEVPFIAVQLLWLNLVTNGIQDVALAFEKGDIETMKQPPRDPGESIFDRLMTRQIIIAGLVICAVTFSAWYYMIEVLHYDVKHARNIAMMLMVLLQNFHALNSRHETKSIFRVPISNNYLLVGGIVLAQVVHISASYIPGLSDVLQLDHISLRDWLRLLPAALSILIVIELFKWLWRKKHGLSNNVVRDHY